jgi:hypothetical protein
MLQGAGLLSRQLTTRFTNGMRETLRSALAKASAGRQTLASASTAGLAGTAAMTAWQELSSRLQSSDGESQSADQDADPWQQAPVPAQAGRKILEGLFDVSQDKRQPACMLRHDPFPRSGAPARAATFR